MSPAERPDSPAASPSRTGGYPAFDEPTSAGGMLTAGRLLIIARRQWWVVVACLVVAAGGSLAYVKTHAPSYEAVAVVAVAPIVASSSSASTASGLPGPDPSTQVDTTAVIDAAAAAAGATSGHIGLTAVTNAAQTAIDVTAAATTATAASRATLGAATTLAGQRVTDITESAAAFQPSISSYAAEITILGRQSANDSAASAELSVVKTQLQTAYQAQLDLQGAAESVAVTTKTPPPAVLAGGSRKKIVEVAVLAGLLVGLGIALLADRLDDRLRSATELAEVGNVALLAELPTRSRADRPRSIVDNPHDELSEAVRELRTALRFLSIDKPLRTLLVTSPGAGEGKSFIAANLAAAWAMSGVTTILVSSDLRRPGLEGLLQTGAPRRGLSEAIADAALQRSDLAPPDHRGGAGRGDGREVTGAERRPIDIDGLVMPTEVDNLFLVAAGPAPPNPADFLGSPHMTAVLDALRARADIVILDSPPVLAVTDALVLTAHADGVLVVLAKGKTSRAAARRALKLLDSGLAPVAGAVLNRSSRSDIVLYPYYDQADPPSDQGRRRRRGPRSGHGSGTSAPTAPSPRLTAASIGTSHYVSPAGEPPTGRDPWGREVVGHDSVGRDPAGRDLAGRDSVGRDSVGRDSVGREPVGREPVGRDSVGREPAGREPAGRDSVGRDSVGREPVGREPVGRDSVGREPVERVPVDELPAERADHQPAERTQ